MLETIFKLYDQQAGDRYGGEAVSQLEHALQCAAQAAQAQAPPTLIAASLLHDIGHLLAARSAGLLERDDRHEISGANYLSAVFASAVTEPIRLHVAAKRYLCTVDGEYYASLSAASQHSLKLQGGPFSAADAQAFIAQPHAREAVQLRRWDEQAKVPGLATPTLADWQPLLAACARSRP